MADYVPMFGSRGVTIAQWIAIGLAGALGAASLGLELDARINPRTPSVSALHKAF